MAKSKGGSAGGFFAVFTARTENNVNDRPNFSLTCRVTKHPNLIANFQSRHVTTLQSVPAGFGTRKFLALVVQQAVKRRTLSPSDMPGVVAAGPSLA